MLHVGSWVLCPCAAMRGGACCTHSGGRSAAAVVHTQPAVASTHHPCPSPPAPAAACRGARGCTRRRSVAAWTQMWTLWRRQPQRRCAGAWPALMHAGALMRGTRGARGLRATTGGVPHAAPAPPSLQAAVAFDIACCWRQVHREAALGAPDDSQLNFPAARCSLAGGGLLVHALPGGRGCARRSSGSLAACACAAGPTAQLSGMAGPLACIPACA